MSEPLAPLNSFMNGLRAGGMSEADRRLVDDIGKAAASKAMESARLGVSILPFGLQSMALLNAMLRLHGAAAEMTKRTDSIARILKEGIDSNAD